jgi:ATP-dependent RNA helicase RhlE
MTHSHTSAHSGGYARRRQMHRNRGHHGGGQQRRSPVFNPKKGFKKDHIDPSLFINKAKVVEEVVYTPKHTFKDFGLPTLLERNLEHKKYVTPSPIQDQAIPVGMAGTDIIGIANTGTGKTAAFLLPLIAKIVTNREHKVLVLAPTRELAQQIEDEFRAFARGLKLFSVACVGGAPIGRQMRELELGVHVVIGTPGRVKDLIDRQKIDTALFGSVVLDEADRMLDMGFIADIRYILQGMSKERHNLFFSATFPKEIQSLCQDFLRDPVTISVKTRDTASAVDQDVVRVGRGENKLAKLVTILNHADCTRVLIFREMKRTAQELADALVASGVDALALHGDMHNRERERAVRSLAQGKVKVVVATDVAARGIDIPDVSHVINYDLPSTYDTYVHRVGRTGRGTRKGFALTFIEQ